MEKGLDESLVTVKGKAFSADRIIKLPIEDDNFEIRNCICVFSIIDPEQTQLQGVFIRKYVWAEEFKKLNKEKANSIKNGYNPHFIFCFTKTKFPLEDFIEEHSLRS